MDKKWLWLLAPLVAYAAYAFGIWTMQDGSSASNSHGVKIKHFEIMSTQLDGCYLMVKDKKTGKIGELEKYSCYEHPTFSDGDVVDMEVWGFDNGRPEYVFKGDYRGNEASYYESNYRNTLGE